jgi:hypothetical protein
MTFIFCRVLPSSKDSYNIISDSEDEIIEQERNNNNNTETQKTVSISFHLLKFITGKYGNPIYS